MRSLYGARIHRLRAELDGVDPTARETILREAIEDFPVAVLVANDQGRYVAANSRACDMTGYTERELVRRSVSDLTPPREQEAASAIWKRFIEQGTQRGDYVLRRKHGSAVNVRYDAFVIAPGLYLFMPDADRLTRPVSGVRFPEGTLGQA